MGDSLTPPDELDFTNTPKSWDDYKTRFEHYRIASGLNEKFAVRQIKMTTYCMSREAESIVTQLNIREPRDAVEADKRRGIETVDAEDAEGTLYYCAIETLAPYFNPRNNHLPSNNHYAVLFMSRSQQLEESQTSFLLGAFIS